ncbi:hypothetical protein NE237_022911 [Protea cynaroides]|uniref:Protein DETOXIFICATION n=1 Tax=Protea cynaroides TaxID=273540 RepID=A0A9Q0K4X3_9MAGN|nr:hypothetical protein NE237_022911 [Protea cynaroides]
MAVRDAEKQIPSEPHWAFCYTMLHKVSRSFALVIQQLGPELRNAVCIFYLVLRALDTVEDDTSIPDDIKVPILKAFHRHIYDRDWHFSCGTKHYKVLMDQFHLVSTAFLELGSSYQEGIEDITKRMGAGMAKFICKEVETVDDYDEYCHYVAGLVGLGLSKLFAASRLEDLAPDSLSNSMGLFLQKTNIIRDYLEDINEIPKSRMFWPRQIWSKYVNRLEDLKYEENSKKAVQCLNDMVTNALIHAEDCLKYLSSLKDPSIFRFCAIPQVMAIGTLALCYNNVEVFRGVVKMRRGLTAKVIDRTKTMSDVYGAFFDLSCMLKSKVDNNDPNATKTCNRVEAIQKTCKESGLLTKRRSYMVESHPRYNSILIMAIFIKEWLALVLLLTLFIRLFEVCRSFTKRTSGRRRRFRTACIGPNRPIEQDVADKPNRAIDNDEDIVSVTSTRQEIMEDVHSVAAEDFDADTSIWTQMKEIVMFAGPATGLWICGPLMSLIDTAVIGQGSSVELAALGPGTVVCDNLSYTFMFLSIATSNMIATSLAREDKNEVQHQISILLFVGLACGVGMLFFTKLLGARILTAFTGPKNMHIVPAANTYVQIRGLAWPALLVGWVAQSASLGMKDSWGPLKALAVASAVNGIGDIILCCFFEYGIAGAAWATMFSQVVAAFMMIGSLNKKGFNAFSLSIPSFKELVQILELAAPVFLTMTSKVAFYSLLVYFATSMGMLTIAAHQVMIQVYCMCTVWGEPLSQTAQSFMPELIYGVNRSLAKARLLLKSLVIIGALTGFMLGAIGTSVPLLFPYLFTRDHEVIVEMHKVLFPYFIALMVTPSTHSLEGTLMAGRDLRFLSLSMSGCFSLGGLLLLLVSSKGCGLPGCWWGLAGFQWARFCLALRRLTSPQGILYSEEFN